MRKKVLKRNFVGREINGWKLLEEIPVEFPDSMSHQSRYQGRLFLVEHLESGVRMERTIGQMVNSKLKMPWERKDYVNLTGTQCGIYKVLEITAESLVPKPRIKTSIMWRCINLETDKEEEVSTTELIRCTRALRRTERAIQSSEKREKERRERHGARTPGVTNQVGHLYRIWQAIKQRCHSPKHNSYKHYGGMGMFVCDEWRNSFERFRDDIVNDIGYCPESRFTTLFVKRGREFKQGNVEWVSIKSRKCALTADGQYGARLVLDTDTKRERTRIEL
jgi:hypothetical protein